MSELYRLMRWDRKRKEWVEVPSSGSLEEIKALAYPIRADGIRIQGRKWTDVYYAAPRERIRT